MSEEELIENAAPTLAGIKTGSLFTCRFDSQEQTRKDLRKLNALLLPKGLRIIPLRMVRGRVLIYVYRISRLGEDLAKQEAREILKQRGYNASSIESCLAMLFKKLREEKDFHMKSASSSVILPSMYAGLWNTEIPDSNVPGFGRCMAMK